MAPKNVRVYDSDHSFVRWIPPAEAQEKLESGLYEDHFELRGGGRTHHVGIRRIGGRPARPSKHESATSITPREMEANALAERIRQRGGCLDEGQKRCVDEIQKKIRMWPFVGDSKAPRAGVRRVHGD
jgi:hypothetical protein